MARVHPLSEASPVHAILRETLRPQDRAVRYAKLLEIYLCSASPAREEFVAGMAMAFIQVTEGIEEFERPKAPAPASVGSERTPSRSGSDLRERVPKRKSPKRGA